MPGSGIFWSSLGRDEQQALREAGRLRTFEPGEMILREGDASGNVAIIMFGTVRVVAGNRQIGRDTVIAVRGSGDILGELAAIDRGTHSATAQAVTRAGALLLTTNRLDALSTQYRTLEIALLRVVSDRLREADRRRTEFPAGIATRLARLLVEYAEQQCPAGAGRAVVDVVSQTDLAGLIGTSRESLARALRDLREQRLVSTSRGRVIIHDLDQLRAVSHT